MSQDVHISEIEITPVRQKDGLIAFASFVLDGRYYIGSVAVFTRLNKEGYRLSYPSRKVGERNINIFYPISAEVGRKIEYEVSKKVEQIFNQDLWANKTTNN